MKMFTDATVNSMSQQSPAFNMANNMMGNPNPRGPPPPAPVKTQEHPPPQRPGMTYTETPGNRPDISASRGSFFKESGVELNNQTNANEAPTPAALPLMAPIIGMFNCVNLLIKG